jgi:hypothetical protein
VGGEGEGDMAGLVAAGGAGGGARGGAEAVEGGGRERGFFGIAGANGVPKRKVEGLAGIGG